ncbi:MAG: PfkB family carbohydrate kinase, partial [Pseudomonadota bacterium]|nr:PfkB family carbohydrate kinase [Pseudomonadota bacterium]
MTQTVLAIGECMVEMAPTGDGHYAMGFAGDTFNTAWYLRKLAGDDLNVSYFSAVGDDAASAQMTAFMQDAGVTPELRVIPGASVGLYMISLKDGERSFSYWRSASAAVARSTAACSLPMTSMQWRRSSATVPAGSSLEAEDEEVFAPAA